MSTILTVRLGSDLARRFESYVNQTGRKKATVVKEALEAKMRAHTGGLPPAAARWAGQVEGPRRSASNDNVRRSFHEVPH